MPRKRYWKKAEAARRVILGCGDTLEKEGTNSDGGRARPTCPSNDGLVHQYLPSDMGTNFSDGGEARPTCTSDDVLVHLPSEHKCDSNVDTCAANTSKNSSMQTNMSIVNNNIIFAQVDTVTDKPSNSSSFYVSTPVMANPEVQIPSLNYYSQTEAPFNCRKIVFGSFNQNDDKFSIKSRGSQCVPNSLCALIEGSGIACSDALDRVLKEGDCLYNKIICDMKKVGTLQSNLLSFDDIPLFVSVSGKKLYVLKSDVCCGIAVEQFMDSSLPSLYQSLHTLFQTSHHLLVMIGAVCSAVFVHKNNYYFFDSHSHGFDGLSSSDGRSVSVIFETLEDLVTYMYAWYDSLDIDFASQYEILPVHFTTSEPTTPTKHESNKQSQWKMVTNKKKKPHTLTSTDVKADKKQFVDNRKNVTQTRDASCRHTETLIGKYFSDQLRRNNLKKRSLLCEYKASNQVAVTLDKANRKAYNNFYKKKQRESIDFKEKERKAKEKARMSEKQREKERQSTLVSKRKARMTDEQKEKDRQSSLVSRRKARKSSKQKEKDRIDTLKCKQTARKFEEFKYKEREQKKRARDRADMKEKERSYQKQSKRRARLVKEFQEWEAEQKRKQRSSDPIHTSAIDRCSKQKHRKDPKFVEKERILKQQWRQDKRKRQKENMLNSVNISCKRKDDCFNEKEQMYAKRRKYGSGIEECIELFHKSVSCGPLYICSCCHQTWFKQSVSTIKSLSDEQQQRFLTHEISADNSEWICCTCKSAILSGKVPKLSVLNGMKWPQRPKELDLHPLEERLIALRIPFMQIRELPRGRQLSIKGNVVNVPVDIQPVVNSLPRPFDENVTVAVKLKKKMSFQSHSFSENVRPVRVLVALHWLMKSSEMYKNANVDIDEQWIQQVTNECSDVLQEFLSSDKQDISQEQVECSSELPSKHKVQQHELYDSDAEEENQENVGNIDTLLDDANTENRNATFTFAPAEGQTPLSIYQDKDSEFLCFPTIFCGERRKENDKRFVSVHYSDVAKWELRSKDRRAANSVPNIFFKLKKLQMKQLNDKVNLAVRRCQQDSSKKLTAADVRDTDYMDHMVKKDEGYYIFKQLRNSPAYLESRKKDVFAMIRQLGLPTWFMSLSSADTKWKDLLKILAHLNENVSYSDEEIDNLTWEQKVKLIQKDPVTCSRYFDHRVMKSTHEPLGKISDYFYRVEFQQRGSPHIHMLVWIENAPKFNVQRNEEITDFVDKYLQCSTSDKQMKPFLDLQIHKHSRTCRKKQAKICRFGYPLPPLDRTMILDPLESDKDKYQKLYQKLQEKMNKEKDGFDMSYSEFLQSVQMDDEEYIKCVRSSLLAPKVFLKRHPRDIRVNLYNKDILRAWGANIDIQFVLDPYACAMYIVSYISKSQRGMSTLLHAAAKEARSGNLDIKRQVRHIGNVFSNSVEVSAQEAVYLILQMPLTKSSRDVVFINTSTSDKRIQLLKQKCDLDDLPDNSTDIMSDNVIKRYSKRPKALDNWCLADYVSQLDICYPEKNETCSEENSDDSVIDEDSDTELNTEDTMVTLKNGTKIRRRKNTKVIRYVRFNRKTDEENYFREKLLLFCPWRNEETDLIGKFSSFKDRYMSVQHLIDLKANEYEHNIDELDLAREAAEAEYDDAYDDIAPSTQQVEADTAEEEPVESEAFIYFNPDRVVEHRDYDIGHEIGCSVSAPQLNVNDRILSDDDYRSLIRSLNLKQKQFYNHVIHWLKTENEPLYVFLSGGAGVGKSVVIRALYQTLYRFLNLREGQDPSDVRILMCAYTGKAAFNIGGSTISSAFKQKYKQSDQTLTCDTLKTFRSKYRNLSVVIIDEISMVSNTMLHFIDQRLQELRGTRQPFGGVSVIAVGDLYQLKPVNGDWIFKDLTRDATALSRNLWKDHFTVFELSEIMRQKDDTEFANLLNRLRVNSLTDEDTNKLSECIITSDMNKYMQNAPHLFAENYFMHLFNDTIIHHMNTEKVVIPCHDNVLSPKLSNTSQKQALNSLPTDPCKTANLHNSLTIVVDMIYDLTVNVNTEDGMANGASCIVKYIEYKQSDTTRPSIVWVLFDDAKAGTETRVKFRNRGFYHSKINESWTPVFDIERTFLYNRKTFQRIQFPLQPSAGRSVHRAQGSTLDSVVIDLSQRKTRKIPHLHYVALSRVRSLKQLQILNFNYKALQVDSQVQNEMERLSKECPLKLCYTPLDTLDAGFTVCFNNCRSLHLHIDDVKTDTNLLSSHVFGLAETRLYASDQDADYQISGFCMIRNDQQKVSNFRPAHGLIVYVKNGIDLKGLLKFSSNAVEFIYIKLRQENQDIQVVFLYKAPSTSNKDLISILEAHLIPCLNVSEPLIVLGDFNIDVSEENKTVVKKIADLLGCKIMNNKPTTDYQSTLDLILSNVSGTVGTFETFWSDHKIIFMCK